MKIHLARSYGLAWNRKLDEAEAEKLFGKRFSEVYNEQTIQGIDRKMVSKPMVAVAVVVGVPPTT
jgi:hypothetical protein